MATTKKSTSKKVATPASGLPKGSSAVRKEGRPALTRSTLNRTPASGVKHVDYVIDATDRTLGRVASEAAHALLGKRSVHYSKNQALPMTVTVNNAGKLHLPVRRTKGKVYTRYTGHPGGLYFTTMEEMIAKKGIAAVVVKTVDGMIPRNKLRPLRMKNLIVNA